MPAHEWFLPWTDRHMSRHPRSDWPRPDEKPEFWKGWRGNFVLHGVAEDVAEEASQRLQTNPPEHVEGHLPGLLQHARAIWRERAESGRCSDDSPEAARRASADCWDCSGMGLATRYRLRSLGTTDSTGRTVAPAITLYCLCPLGRMLERNHRADAPEVRKRLYDLADYPWLRDAYREPPSQAELDVEAVRGAF